MLRALKGKKTGWKKKQVGPPFGRACLRTKRRTKKKRKDIIARAKRRKKERMGELMQDPHRIIKERVD